METKELMNREVKIKHRKLKKLGWRIFPNRGWVGDVTTREWCQAYASSDWSIGSITETGPYFARSFYVAFKSEEDAALWILSN